MDPSTEQRCGKERQQARSVCDQSRANGKVDCENAWSTVRAMLKKKSEGSSWLTQAHAGVPRTSGHPQAQVMPLSTVDTVHAELKRAQLATMAKVADTQNRLRVVQESGMVDPEQQKEAASAVLNLFALEGVSGSIQSMLLQHPVSH